MKKNLYQLLLLVTGIHILAQACTYSKEAPQPACSSVPDTVSFKTDIIPILNANCSLSGCHSNPDPQSSLNLSASVAYSQLMKPGTGYVVASHPGSSILYSQITNASQIMPPSGKLDNCSISLVQAWIQQGAKNN